MDETSAPVSLGLPLNGGQLQALPSNAGTPDLVQALNQAITTINNHAQLINYTNGQVSVAQLGNLPSGAIGFKILDANGVGIALFGQYVDGTTNLKVAKPGIEVETATDDELIFNSGQDVYKIILEDSIDITPVAPGDGFASFKHGLGFIPSVEAYVNIDGDFYQPLPYINAGTLSGEILIYQIIEIVSIDDQELEFIITSRTGQPTIPIPISFKLLQETANSVVE